MHARAKPLIVSLWVRCMLLVSLIEDFNSEALDQGHLKSSILTALACKGFALDLVLLFLRSKNNNKHACAKRMIVTLRVTMVSRRRIAQYAFKILLVSFPYPARI